MRKLVVTVCLICCCSGTTFASGFSIYEASVRANSMLGAFAAFADHVSTIFYNPAGLGGLEGLQISGGISLIMPRTTFRNTTTPGARFGAKYKMVENNFPIPNFYASYQITDRLTAGVGVYVPFGLGTKWPKNWVGRGASIKASLKTLFVNPAVGYVLPDFGIGKIRVGFGLRIVASGSVELSRAVTSFTPEGAFYLQGELAEPAYGYNFGILYQPVEDVTLGFTYRSSINVDFEGTAEFNNLAVGFPAEAKGSTSIDLPASWVAAVNVQFSESLTLEADYVWFGWSSFDKLVIKFNKPIVALGGNTIVSKRNYQNSWQIRVGGEYKEFGVEGLTLRAGIAYDKNPVPERYVGPMLPDTDRWEFSAGLSYAFNKHIAVDIAYIFVQGQQRRVENTISGIDGVYNTYANIPSIGFTLTY